MTLAEEFRQICQTYFPRWRAATEWCLEESPRASWSPAQGERQATLAQGYCDPTTRRITIHVAPANVLQRQAAIMHEICHAITTVGHGARFRAQMDQAVTRALALGATALAAELRRQANEYRSSGRPPVWEAPKSALPVVPHAQLTDRRRFSSPS